MIAVVWWVRRHRSRPIAAALSQVARGQDDGGEQAADGGHGVGDQDRRDQPRAWLFVAWWFFPRLARVTARNAWASMLMVMCRYHGVHLRTW
jgi:hypothetical protein